MSNSDKKYQQALTRMAYEVSHKFRKLISTMMGLICLIELDLLTAEECEHTIQMFKVCLESLDKSSRELGTLIRKEQVSNDGTH